NLAIVNADDPLALACAAQTRAVVLRFSSTQTIEQGAFLDGDEIVLRIGSREERYPTADLQLVGRHNLENAMAAYLAASWTGVTPDAIRAAAREFHALPHRMELVGEGRGVRYYDDSKGTNVGAVVASLDGFPRPFLLIAGGKHKGGDYAPLRRVLADRCRALVLIGEAARLMAEALGDVVPGVRADSMEQAVGVAAPPPPTRGRGGLPPPTPRLPPVRDF